MLNYYLKLILILCSVTLLAQCGKDDSESGKIDLSFTPEEPFVRITDTDVDNDGDIDYSKNWLRFSICIENKSSKTLTIFGFTVEAFDNSGTSLGTADFDSPTNFAEIAAGKSHNLKSGECDETSASPLVLIVEGISDPQNDNFRLRVNVEPLGFFGTDAAPEDRFKNQYTFYTQ